MNRGLLYVVGGYVLWGLSPVYWKMLQGVPSLEVVGHRAVWSCLFLLLLLAPRQGWGHFRRIARDRKTMLVLACSAALMSGNWIIFVWAINNGLVVESSLGYFINPLFSVLLAVLLLQEKMRPWQWVAIAVALIGVLYLTLNYGAVPWVALSLAFCFGTYGLLKKLAPQDALQGLSVETAFLFVPALCYLLFLQGQHSNAFVQDGLVTSLLLIGAGPVTAIPYVLFVKGVPRIPLAMAGVLQYVSPILQFLLGVLAFGETFDRVQMVGYGIVWLALLIFTIEGLVTRRRVAVVAHCGG